MPKAEEAHLPPAKRKKLAVVFDTSAIYTDSGFRIISAEVKRLIQDTRKNAALDVTWLVPSVVLQERIYRLQQKIASLMAQLSSISDLTGGDLDISEGSLLEALDRKVQQTLGDYGIEVREPDWPRIDLKQMAADSANRQPPFNPGNPEKGFRDAIVLETYLQLLQDPRFADHLAVLLTTDELLRKAVARRAGAFGNQYPPGSSEDIRGTIATISEELELELINRMVSVASALFFTPSDPNSVFARFGIPAKIQSQYESAFSARPPGADLRRTFAPTIYQSRFVEKVGDRFHWSNQIAFPSVAYRITYSVGPSSSSLGVAATGTYSSDLLGDDPSSLGTGAISSASSGFPLPNPSYVPTSNGRTLFEVVWSAIYSEDQGLTEPNVEKLIFRGTEWS